ncbi:insulinase family protein [Candidatus Woesearchaeota archaeon]|nr:insulinase family protein [Candidatus Woesearchaeota archaeon]MBW3016208.1 insulinase family protein [Candidatus Woesearchaeota archaeon]
MDFERRVLKNGLRVFIERKPIGECAAYLIVKAGWVHDSIPEISHVLEHLQASGSRIYGKKGILNYAKCNAFTGFDNTMYYFSCFFPEHLPNVLKNLSRVLSRPHIRWLDRELGSVNKELNEDNCAEARLDERIFSILSPKHDRMFSDNKTSRLNIDKIDVFACCDFFGSFYVPCNAFLYVSGDLNSELEEGLLIFDRIKRGKIVKPVKLPKERVLEKRVEFSRRKIEKPFVKIAHQLPALSALPLQKNIAKTFLFEYLSEDFGPLNRRLRDKKNICYSYSIGLSYTGNAGEVILRVEAEPDCFPDVEKEYLKTLGQIALKGISKEILETFRYAYKMQLIHKASHFDIKRVLNEIDYNLQPSDIEQAVAHVSKEDVAYVARMLLDRGYVVAKGLP